jgi:hypothetical protein
MDMPEFGKLGQKLCGCLCGCRLVPNPGGNISDSQYLIRSRNRNIAAMSFRCTHVDQVCVYTADTSSPIARSSLLIGRVNRKIAV